MLFSLNGAWCFEELAYFTVYSHSTKADHDYYDNKNGVPDAIVYTRAPEFYESRCCCQLCWASDGHHIPCIELVRKPMLGQGLFGLQ